MRLITLSLIPWLVPLTACSPTLEDFAQECQSIARVEVKDAEQWQLYLQEREHELGTSKPTVNRPKRDTTDLFPVISTKRFSWTNDWLLEGSPNVPKHKIYRNNAYITRKDNNEFIARFDNLTIRIASISVTSSHNCINDHPYLYTGDLQFTR